MADGYISQIKTPDNKVYLLKDSEKTDEKVKQASNTEDKEFPILFKNTNNTTEETAGVKYSGNTTADATTTKPFTFNPSTGNLTVTQLKIGTKNDNMGLFPNLNNWNQIGSGSLYWYRSYINNYYGGRSHVDNWDSGKNIGTAASASAAAVLGTVNFYNTAAAGATQTKTLLTADSTTNSNITITLPKTTGTLALKSELPTLSGLSGIGTISASGTAPLTLSGSKSGTTYTLTGSIADASASASGVVNTDAQTFGGTKTFNGGMHIYGSVSMSGSTVTNMYSGGAYHAGHNSLVLHGDSAGISGIGFTSQKATDSGNAANINSPSDRAFIQYHSYGVTAAAEGNAPTLATSGELGTLVIGVGNDATDTIRLQAPSTAGILHQIGATAYPIPHTTNTNGTVGGTTTPVYVDAGVIKALSYTIAKSVPSDAKFTDTNTTYTFVDGTNGFTVTPLGGTAQTVTVTPSIANNITGSGTANYLTKFTGDNTIGTTSIEIDNGNNISFPAEAGIKFRMNRKRADGGGWAHECIDWYDNSDSIFARMGIYGGHDALAYIFIGADDYSSQNNLRIAPNGTILGKLFSGSGASLTSLNASNLSSGTVPVARLPLATTSAAGAVIIGDGISIDDGTISVTAENLGLSNALHFIGITSTDLTNGSTTATLTAKTTNSLSKTTGFVDGDVVMDGDQLREYVWSGSAWRLLGITTSTAYKQPASTATNTWIAQVSQGTDGKITATTGSLNTSGTWSGTASKATTTADTSNTLYIVGVASGATTTLKHDTSVTVKDGAISATTYNALILTAATTGFTIAGGSTTSKTLTVSESITLQAGTASKLAWYSANNTISGARNAYLIDESGTSVANKKNELVLGNATGKATNGSSFGRLALYSPGTTGTYLVSAESSNGWFTATLPAKTGIIAYTSDIEALDVSNISGFGAGKTLATLTETDGKIAATFQDISITKSQISDFTHTHNYLEAHATINSGQSSPNNNFKLAIKKYFDDNKSTVLRNSLINFYSSAYGNGSDVFGYFISGYDSNPYGGFYVAHYDTPRYVGILGGTYTESKLARIDIGNTINSGQVMISDGTDGKIKSSGYTIAKSVPSNAIFTDHYAWGDITSKPTTLSGYGITDAMSSSTTVTNVSYTSASDNAEYPILMKNSTAGTTTAAGVKFNTGVTINPSESSITATEFIGNIKANKIIPTLQKTYTGNYYGTGDNYDSTSFFFISLKPDTWYKPWKIKFKIRSYCPAHTECESVTYGLYTGRLGSYSYANWNERNDSYAHYYTSVRTLNQAGFNAGLSHALGICIRYSSNYTNTGWPRTFEVEIYDYEGCTVSLLDTPLLWANWPNAANHYNGWSVPDAVTRGLCETNDATANNDDRTLQDIMYFRFKSGAAGIGRYTLLMEESTGVYSSLTTTFPSSNTPLTTLTMNTGVKYKLGRIIYFNQGANRAGNTNIGSDNQYFTAYSLIDGRYTFQYAAGALTGYKPFYMVGTLDANGFFTIDPAATAWTQDLPTTNTNKVYVFLGTVYPDTNAYRIALELDHPVYTFTNGALKQINPGNISGNAETASSVAWTNVSSKPDTATRWPKWSEIQAGADGLNEGTSNWTDHTEILTSYASDNGFADSASKGVVYRRDALCAYNYIKGKLDSVYVAKTAGVTAVTWDATNKKLTRTINGSTADVMTAAQISTALGLGTIASKAENSYMKFGGDDTNLGSGSPAATAKTYWADTDKVSDNMITGYYNHSGIEYSLLFSKRATYGSIVKWGYNDRYLRILRIHAGTWQSTDWEKMDAGYADSAGSVAWTNVSSRPTKISLTGAVTGSVSLGSGDLSLATTVNHTHSYAGSSSAGGAATNATTTANTTDSIYPVGVKSGATTTLLHDTSITMKGGAVSATTYTVNSHVTLQYNSTDFSLEFVFA